MPSCFVNLYYEQSSIVATIPVEQALALPSQKYETAEKINRGKGDVLKGSHSRNGISFENHTALSSEKRREGTQSSFERNQRSTLQSVGASTVTEPIQVSPLFLL